ncbi:GMC family oxidoreductase N-terminal domain-containing protein [Burkholderia anthina]|uniref:GMC family oxidoreductase n=1 Tax=Burkholderia anthina TaxID=179879 RepID=UPI001589334A
MFDYIVVGGGSAGSALTGRLIDAGASVLLLEAGPRDKHPLIHVPAGFTRLLPTHLLYHYETVPQVGMDSRPRVVPQGRTLGGGSSVNALIYIRGQREDYDEWQRGGCDGWSYRDVLPYFRRAEHNERFHDAYHGAGGPLSVEDLVQRSELTTAFVRAGQEAGIPYSPDFNGARQNGVGFNQITTRERRRCSAAVAYLRKAEQSGRLKIVTGAQVDRIVIEGGRAVGVEYRHGGRKVVERGCKEVIVSGGSIQSPRLLMLSGIGPAAQLEQHGIPVIQDLPGVGANLQDHAEFPAVSYCTGRYGYFGEDTPLNTVKNGLQYLLFRSGPVASNVAEACAFINVDEPEARPNVQLHFLPIVFLDLDAETIKRAGATINPCVLRPMSRGEIRLTSADPDAKLEIDPRYFQHPEDCRLAVKGLKAAREILAQDALRQYTGEEALPGPSVHSDDDLLDYIRRRSKTVYHPVGTCKMGVDGAAVVDPALRVRGVAGLRVVDASIMPNLISGNTNAASIMIGEKAADTILGKQSLAVAAV